MATLLPNALTPVEPSDAGAALSKAYATIAGSKPKPAVLNLLLAQWALETGNGKFVHNFNFGNEKSASGDQYYQEFEAGEVADGQEQKSVMKFAAFTNIDDGALAYVKTLQHRPQWWAGLQSGDPHTFVSALVAVTGQHYFTADPARYLKTLMDELPKYASIAKQYGRKRFAWVAIALGMIVGAAVGYRLSARTNRPPTSDLRTNRPQTTDLRLPTAQKEI